MKDYITMNDLLDRLAALYGATVDWEASDNDIYIRNCNLDFIRFMEELYPNKDCSKGAACIIENSTTIRLA